VGQIVISEIMNNPVTAGAEFVELYNNSATTGFDLSGWVFKGLGYTFPPGTFLGPNQYLVLAANRASFAGAYGGTNIVFDTYPGTLQFQGETLTLVQPSTGSQPELAVARVRYGSSLPWPAQSNTAGSSLQLIDSLQDNWRVGNWAAIPANTNATVLTAATPGMPNAVATALPAFPTLWLNEIQADNRTGITNKSGTRTGWIELYNPSPTAVNLTGLYLTTNYNNLAGWSFPTNETINPRQFMVIFTDGLIALSGSNELHTSFVLNSGSGSLALSRAYNGQMQVLDYIDYTNLSTDHSYGSMPDGQSFERQEFLRATPGTSNSTSEFPSFIGYSAVGAVYTQDFNGLPNPGTASVNAANPVTISGVSYGLANPFEFAGPVAASGTNGGLGVQSMDGWYGWGALTSKFGATDGDQTTGGNISFGLPGNGDRALGLLATSSTGATHFGAKLVNQTGRALNYISLEFVGELWRQSDIPKTLGFHYWIDPTGKASSPPDSTTALANLDVKFPTESGAVGGLAVDGTASANQTTVRVVNQPIGSWAPGAALWLIWDMADVTGKAQGLAIDDLIFQASDQEMVEPGPELEAQISLTDLVLRWESVAGAVYQIEYTDDLASGQWLPLAGPITGTGGVVSSTNVLSRTGERFFRLSVAP
jgi:hypothetical protein